MPGISNLIRFRLNPPINSLPPNQYYFDRGESYLPSLLREALQKPFLHPECAAPSEGIERNLTHTRGTALLPIRSRIGSESNMEGSRITSRTECDAPPSFPIERMNAPLLLLPLMYAQAGFGDTNEQKHWAGEAGINITFRHTPYK